MGSSSFDALPAAFDGTPWDPKPPGGHNQKERIGVVVLQ